MKRSSKRKLLIIGASIRNRSTEDVLVNAARSIDDEPHLYEYIEQCARSREVSNTEGCGIPAAYGALKEGVEVQYLRLNEHITKRGQFRNASRALERIEEADGYVFLSPVYFGDRSSLLFELLELMKKEGVSLENKVYGLASVGAKRNGGQETTNLYTLYNLLPFGGVAVGNGPPTSQYGGTAVGGNIGTMDNDYFGIMTSMGVGSKVAHTIKLLHTRPAGKPKIAFWVTEDFGDRRLLKYLEKLVGGLPSNVEWDILDLTKYQFHACLACNRCPNRPDNPEYKCVLTADDMKEVENLLVPADGFVVCGLSYVDERGKRSNYQRFVERTRYLRRDDFRLTDRAFFPLTIQEPFADNSFEIRSLTSFIRHNAMGHRGLRVIQLQDEVLEPDIEGLLEEFTLVCRKGRAWRERQGHTSGRYEAIGYEPK